MFKYLDRTKEWTRQWATKHAQGKHAKGWLAATAFAEASFFPVPPDILLIALLLSGVKAWVQLVGITTLFSVLGGLFGYVIGVFLFETIGAPLVAFYHLESQMAEIGELFQEHSFITLFAAAFTPIPYKVFTIAAGLFHIDILLFTLAAIIGRGARFGVIGYAVHRYGKRISTFLYDYFNLLSLVILLAIVVILFTSFK